MPECCSLPQNARSLPISLSRIVAVCVVGLGLAACSEAQSGSAEAGVADGPVFDVSLEDAPCELVTREIVAEVFSVPVDQIKAASGLSDYCNYEGEIDGKILNVNASVDVFETASAAADSFRSVTAGMSAAEVSEAMAGAVEQAEEQGALETQSQKQAADAMVDGLASGGLKFVEVEELADHARFGLRFGTLYLVRGNMRIDLTAYHAPGMPMPETMSVEAIQEAGSAWQDETRPVRKRQSIDLAKAVLAALQSGG
jgi:hypothetical protein